MGTVNIDSLVSAQAFGWADTQFVRDSAGVLKATNGATGFSDIIASKFVNDDVTDYFGGVFTGNYGGAFFKPPGGGGVNTGIGATYRGWSLFREGSPSVVHGSGYPITFSDDIGFWDQSDGTRRAADLRLGRDAANTLAQRNGTNAQAFNIYNTYTDASNYERAYIRWSANQLLMGTEAAGTGSSRNIAIVSASAIQFSPGGSWNWEMNGGAFLPNSNNARDIGSASKGVRYVYVAGAVRTKDAGELTIATGAVTVTGGYHTIDTESDAASDDLDTINGGADGQLLVVQAENSTRTVVAKDGTGNLQLAGDFSLDNTQDSLTLLYSAALSAWVEISRSDNGA